MKFTGKSFLYTKSAAVLKIVILLFAAGLFFSCASVVVEEVDEKKPFKTYRRPTGNPTVQSIELYTLGEQALAEQNYRFTLMLFQQADVFDPANVSIKERILHTSLLKAERDSTFYREAAELGDKYIEAELITPEIYRYTGRAHISLGSIDRGVLLKKLALQIDPDPFHYYDLFFYLARHAERLEFIYLEKALERGWEHPRLIKAIANIYEHRIPLRSKEILEKAYKLYYGDELMIVESLLNFYRKFNDWNSFRDTIDNRIDESRKIPEEHLRLYLEYLLDVEDYQRIGEVAHLFRFIDELAVQVYLFYASFYNEDYHKTITKGEQLLSEPKLTDDELLLVNIYVGKSYYYLGDTDRSAAYLSNVKEPVLLLGVFHELMEEERSFDVGDFIKKMIKDGFDPSVGYFMKAVYNLDQDDREQFELYVNMVLAAENDDVKFWEKLAVILLEENYTEKAKESLARSSKPEHEKNLYIGEYFYHTQDDSLAIEYIKQSLELAPQDPEPYLFLILASLYNRNNRHDEELRLMQRAVEIHPDDSYILNWLGYTLVVKTDRYDEAKEYLLKAIELEPHSYHIQDSVAWLYYKLSEYDKALYYMQDIIENGVEDSVVSYHIGMIYLRLDEKAKAREYLEKALQLDDDDEAVAKAREVLASIGE